MFEGKKIVLILPARNEANSLRLLLPRVPEWVDEVIVVDNGSVDPTAEVACSLGARVISEPRPGYGAACAAGLEAAFGEQPDFIGFLDSDSSEDPESLARLLQPLATDDADLVIGRREGREGMTLPQRLGNGLVCRILSWGFSQPVTDLGPFRAATADCLRSLPLRDRGFGWTAEMQAQALRFGYRVTEVGVRWQPGIGHSEISGTSLGIFRAARDLLRRSLREIIGARWHRSLAAFARFRARRGRT